MSYASAWLRTYYPAEFAAAILNNEPMGFYTPRLVVNDARRHGIEILPPHVNESSARYTVERDGRAIRVGLRDVHRMTARLLGEIERERAVRPFRDLADFLRRTRAEMPGRRVARAHRRARRARHHRGGPAAHARRAARAAARDQGRARARGRGGRRHAVPRARADAPARGPVARERLERGSAALGGARAHGALADRAPARARARDDLEARGVTWARDLRALPDRTRVRVVGVRERAQTPRTRSGKRTCFLTLEDPTGLLDVVVFADALARSGETIVKHRAYLVDGTLQNNCERGLAIVADVGEALRGAHRAAATACGCAAACRRADGAGTRRCGCAGGGELGGRRSGARTAGRPRTRGDVRLHAERATRASPA